MGMGGLYPALPIGIAIAVFGLLARHSLEMRGKKNYREMWGAAFLSFVPAGIFCAIWAWTGEPDVAARNIVLIPIGAILGACASAWAGYYIHDTTDRSKLTPNGPPIAAPSVPRPLSQAEQRQAFLNARQQMELAANGADGTPIKHEFDQTGIGSLTIANGTSTYTIPVSKSSGTNVWIYDTHLPIAKLFIVRTDIARGQIVDTRQLRLVRRSDVLNIGDRAIVEMLDGTTIQLLLVGVLYYGAGDDSDEARFKYKIYDAGDFLIPAL